MRILDPLVHDRESICRFLTANGLDPARIPKEPFVYDGRKREIRINHIVFLDGELQLDPQTATIRTVATRHRVLRGHEPAKYVERASQDD